MARIAGLRLKERWAGWNRELFKSTSRNVVSVSVEVAALPKGVDVEIDVIARTF